MRKLVAILSLIFLCFASYAQISFKTGDSELDIDLARINTNAKGDFSAFKTDLTLSYNVSEKKIDYLQLSIKMEPAEIYLTLELSKISKKSIDDVVEIYNAHKEKGWGFIAKQLGIKPGSAEFHSLKGSTKSKGNKKGTKKKIKKG